MLLFAALFYVGYYLGNVVRIPTMMGRKLPRRVCNGMEVSHNLITDFVMGQRIPSSIFRTEVSEDLLSYSAMGRRIPNGIRARSRTRIGWYTGQDRPRTRAPCDRDTSHEHAQMGLTGLQLAVGQPIPGAGGEVCYPCDRCQIDSIQE